MSLDYGADQSYYGYSDLEAAPSADQAAAVSNAIFMAPDEVPTAASSAASGEWGGSSIFENLAANSGKIFGSVTGLVNQFNAQRVQLEQSRQAFELTRENADLIRDQRNAEAAMVRTQGQQALDLAKIKGTVEIAKANTELTRANALDRIYASNPLYAATGIPGAGVTGINPLIWIAIAGVGLFAVMQSKNGSAHR